MAMKLSKSSIYVTFQKEGIHCYPAALTDENLKEVQFLGHPHRHIFHFLVTIQVFHMDRNLEFILFKRELESLYGNGILNLNNKSCEMIAEDLAAYLMDRYPNRELTITVSEDNENGATLEYKNI